MTDLQGSGSVFTRLRRFGLIKLVLLMLGLALALGIASVHLIPLVTRLGLSPRLADKLPYLGFASGLLVGLLAPVSHALMLTLQIGLVLPLLAFALLGSVLSVLASALWAIAMLDALLIGALVTVAFVPVLMLLDAAFRRKGSVRDRRA
jgi:hypothetical protein